uniref:Uncharacterized protein n=1 Tax=Anguilla anguilla TaxID=7936 RepID=A0A0E9QPW2_ANGAN
MEFLKRLPYLNLCLTSLALELLNSI